MDIWNDLSLSLFLRAKIFSGAAYNENNQQYEDLPDENQEKWEGEENTQYYDESAGYWSSEQDTGDKFNCENCGRAYRHKRNLWRHQKYECGTLPKFNCPLCVHKFRQKSHLNSHMYRYHPQVAVVE